MKIELKKPKKEQSLAYTVQMKGEGAAVFNMPICKGSNETTIADRDAALTLLSEYIKHNPGKKFRMVMVEATTTKYDWINTPLLKRITNKINSKTPKNGKKEASN